jgi:hypothetical protein
MFAECYPKEINKMSDNEVRYCKVNNKSVNIHHIPQGNVVCLACEHTCQADVFSCEEKCVYSIGVQMGISTAIQVTGSRLNADGTFPITTILQLGTSMGIRDFTSSLETRKSPETIVPTIEYFEVPEAHPGQDGICSDNDCPCGYPGAKIPRGSGYMYISEAVVDFRRDARTVQEAERKIALMQQQMNVLFDQNVVTSTLMCEQGARKRGLDLDVAAADAKNWWETGLLPLRATPLTDSPESRKENEQPKSVAQSSSEKIPVAPLQVSREGKITTEFQGGKKLLASGVMLIIGFIINLIPFGVLLVGCIAAIMWIKWEKTMPANTTKRGAVAGLLAGIGAFFAQSNFSKSVDPASTPIAPFVGILTFLLLSLPLAVLMGALTGYIIGRKGKTIEVGVTKK